MISAGGSGQLHLRVRAHGGDNLGSSQLGHLHDQASGAARARVDQAPVAGADPRTVGDQVVGGEALHADGGGRVEIDTVGHLERHRRLDRGPFGVGPGRPGPGHPVARRESLNPRADLQHGACSLLAEHQRQTQVVEARAVVGVDEVDPGRGHRHHQLALTRHRVATLYKLHHLRPAGLGDLNCRASGAFRFRHVLCLPWPIRPEVTAAACLGVYSSSTGLRRVPISGTVTSTTSPGSSHTGGSKRAPAPVGVPVKITSPASSSTKVDR